MDRQMFQSEHPIGIFLASVVVSGREEVTLKMPCFADNKNPMIIFGEVGTYSFLKLLNNCEQNESLPKTAQVVFVIVLRQEL